MKCKCGKDPMKDNLALKTRQFNAMMGICTKCKMAAVSKQTAKLEKLN
jgi:hypothetical protein